eukprot:gene1932-2196_t
MECIPPTKAALIEHTKRAVFQGGHCWGQLQIAVQHLLCPTNWGWARSEEVFEQFWVQEGCKKGCHGHCKCVKAALRCTALCQCGGDCDS